MSALGPLLTVGSIATVVWLLWPKVDEPPTPEEYHALEQEDERARRGGGDQ